MKNNEVMAISEVSDIFLTSLIVFGQGRNRSVLVE